MCIYTNKGAYDLHKTSAKNIVYNYLVIKLDLAGEEPCASVTKSDAKTTTSCKTKASSQKTDHIWSFAERNSANYFILWSIDPIFFRLAHTNSKHPVKVAVCATYCEYNAEDLRFRVQEFCGGFESLWIRTISQMIYCPHHCHCRHQNTES